MYSRSTLKFDRRFWIISKVESKVILFHTVYMGDFMLTVEGQHFKIAHNFFSRSKLAPKGKYRVLDQNIKAF